MNWKEIFNPRGANLWHIANSIGFNFIWTGATLLISYYFLEKTPGSAMPLQFGLMISVFLGGFSSGLLFGKLAADRRGLTYGMIGSLGSITISLFLISGIFGIMLSIIALAGGLNGGLLSLRPKSKS